MISVNPNSVMSACSVYPVKNKQTKAVTNTPQYNNTEINFGRTNTQNTNIRTSLTTKEEKEKWIHALKIAKVESEKIFMTNSSLKSKSGNKKERELPKEIEVLRS